MLRRQLLVRHRGLDPTAWTALEALARLARRGRPGALARAALWEFSWDGDAASEGRLGEWVAEANWFANPNRDRATWRRASSDPTEMEAGAALLSGGVGASGAGAYLVSAWRGAVVAGEHAAAATRALGRPVQVLRAQVWWLGAAASAAAAILEEAGAGAAGGLLVNPHSERAWLFAGDLPVPLLDTGEENRQGALGGAEGR